MESIYKDRYKFVKEEKERQNSGETPIVALSGFSCGWRGEGRMQTGWDWGKKGNIDGRGGMGAPPPPTSLSSTGEKT
jgi:hypothetical protein